MKFSILLLLFFAFSNVVYADGSGLDAPSTEALEKTNTLLKDQSAFNKAASENEQTKAAAKNLQLALPDSANQQEAREISAMAMSKMVEETKGDPEKLKALVSELQSNPNLLDKYLSPEARERLHKLSAEVESKMGRVPSAR